MSYFSFLACYVDQYAFMLFSPILRCRFLKEKEKENVQICFNSNLPSSPPSGRSYLTFTPSVSIFYPITSTFWIESFVLQEKYNQFCYVVFWLKQRNILTSQNSQGPVEPIHGHLKPWRVQILPLLAVLQITKNSSHLSLFNVTVIDQSTWVMMMMLMKKYKMNRKRKLLN